jgi:2-hydroxycyclohexanecarboxyl-CoA dehydrogenase
VSGRVALVTGGGRGIGRAIARGLADDGFAILIVDLRVEDAKVTVEDICNAGGSALALQADVSNSASVEAAIRQAHAETGPIDVLVNNAGWDELKLFVETDEEFWDRVIGINLKGPLRFSRRLLPGMIERRWGRVINVGSDAGRVGSSMEAVYSGAKGGIIAFTKTLAREVARSGVTANVVCPGPTDTPWMREVLAASGDGERTLKAMLAGVPMRRLALPEEIAGAVRFFASDVAGYVTGQTLSVSGGLTMA